jgi:hypothetical protein
MTTGWNIRSTAHYIAHEEAHRIATKNARKVAKVARYLQGVSEKLVRDTVYRSAYEELYRERFRVELIDLVLRNVRAAGQTDLTNEGYAIAADAGSGLHALFGVQPEDRA